MTENEKIKKLLKEDEKLREKVLKAKTLDQGIELLRASGIDVDKENLEVNEIYEDMLESVSGGKGRTQVADSGVMVIGDDSVAIKMSEIKQGYD